MNSGYQPDRLTVDTARMIGELDSLAAFSDAEPPAVTRVLWTAPDLQARAYMIGLFEAAGLTVRQDAIGNIFARWLGTAPDLAAVGTGSHTDAIPQSGRYDGTVGVLGALEALRALRASGFVPRRSLEILLFTAEEPTRFGIGCLGSRVLSGALAPECAAELRDSDGITVDEARTDAGQTESLGTVPLLAGYYAGCVELHIEQGPILEQRGIAIGVVTAIAAPATLRVSLSGPGGHAGAVLMPERRDPLPAAAEIALAVERAARETGSRDSVATTGLFRVSPGAVNSIPRLVEMEIDIRDTDLARRDGMVARIRAEIAAITEARGVECTVQILNADPPATCDPAIVAAVTSAARTLGLSSLPMVSRAYHDTLFMARLGPVGMIFIPCRDGVSHRPDEYSTPEQITDGVAVLAHTLAQLSWQEGGADDPE